MRYVLIVHAWPGQEINPLTGFRWDEGPLPLTPASQLFLSGHGQNYELRADGLSLGMVAAVIRDYADEVLPPTPEEVPS